MFWLPPRKMEVMINTTAIITMEYPIVSSKLRLVAMVLSSGLRLFVSYLLDYPFSSDTLLNCVAKKSDIG